MLIVWCSVKVFSLQHVFICCKLRHQLFEETLKLYRLFKYVFACGYCCFISLFSWLIKAANRQYQSFPYRFLDVIGKNIRCYYRFEPLLFQLRTGRRIQHWRDLIASAGEAIAAFNMPAFRKDFPQDLFLAA